MKTKRFNKVYILASILMLCLSFFSLFGGIPSQRAKAEENLTAETVTTGVKIIDLFETEELEVGDTITDKWIYTWDVVVEIVLSSGTTVGIENQDGNCAFITVTVPQIGQYENLASKGENYMQNYVYKINSGTYYTDVPEGYTSSPLELSATDTVAQISYNGLAPGKVKVITGQKYSTNPIDNSEGEAGQIVNKFATDILSLKPLSAGDKVGGKIIINELMLNYEVLGATGLKEFSLSNGLFFGNSEGVSWFYLNGRAADSTRVPAEIILLNKGTLELSTGETYVIDDSTTIAGDSLDGLYTIDEGSKTGENGTHIGGGSSINSGSSTSKTENGELSNIEIFALVVTGILEFVILCFVGMSLKGKAMLTIVLMLLAGFIGADVALYLYFV